MDDVVVVGVDGSEESEAAMVWASRLAHKTGSGIVAVHSMGLLERLGTSEGWVSTSRSRDEIEHTFTERWCEVLRRLGADYTTELAYGPPADGLLAAARRLGASLIVVGRRGVGRVSSRQLGSTSLRLACEADVPVMIVPARPAPARRSAVLAADEAGSPQ